MAVSQIQKRNELNVELYINEDKELFKSLFQRKEAIETEIGSNLDWKELPEKKASRIIACKTVKFTDRDQWHKQFDWIMDMMLKMKKAFKRYL